MTDIARHPPVERGAVVVSATTSTANHELPAPEPAPLQPATDQSKPPGQTPPLAEPDALLEDVSIDEGCGIF